MDRLWAPWRTKYLKAKKYKRCIFCGAKKTKEKRYIFLESPFSLCVLNIFPYNNGHIMVAPKRHVRELRQLPDAEILDLLKNVCASQELLDSVLKPEGYNIGINVSSVAGAGIAGHLHIHIVPRWRGDTNFMPVVHGTKVISQSLDELCMRLKAARTRLKRHA